MADPFQRIEDVLQQGEAELTAVAGADALEQFRIRYLGAKGSVKALMDLLREVPREQKPAVGQRVNAVRDRLTAAFEDRKQQLAAGGAEEKDAADVTEPGRQPEIGSRHILMKTIDELVELFGRMGFAVASGPEVEDEFHNFVALNIPESHPARDPLDNFYLQNQATASARGKGPLPLRTQPSTVQIGVMEIQERPL